MINELLAGATGALGWSLVPALVKEGRKVVAMSLREKAGGLEAREEVLT